MDHYRDLSTYTTIAAETVQTKAVNDAGRVVATVAWTAVDALDTDTRNEFNRVLDQLAP